MLIIGIANNVYNFRSKRKFPKVGGKEMAGEVVGHAIDVVMGCRHVLLLNRSRYSGEVV